MDRSELLDELAAILDSVGEDENDPLCGTKVVGGGGDEIVFNVPSAATELGLYRQWVLTVREVKFAS